MTSPRIIITCKFDVTNQLPADFEKMSTREIVEYFGDTPELIQDREIIPSPSGNIVWEVERREEGK